MSNLSKMKIRTPNCSAFPIGWNMKFTDRLGEMPCIAAIELSPNDRLKLSVQQMTRLMPMSAPVMANFNLQVDAVFVPARIVSKKYEKFFNPGTNDEDRPCFPQVSYADYIRFLFNYRGLFTPGLLDYLGYPTFPLLQDFVRNLVTTYISEELYDADVNSTPSERRISYFMPEQTVYCRNVAGSPQIVGAGYVLYNPSHLDNTYFAINEDGKFGGVVSSTTGLFAYAAEGNIGIPDFLTWLICSDMGEVPSVQNLKLEFKNFMAKYGIMPDKQDLADRVDFVYPNYSYGTQSDIVSAYLDKNNLQLEDVLKKYFNFVAARLNAQEETIKFYKDSSSDARTFLERILLSGMSNATYVDDFAGKSFSLLPIFSYWKAYFDWYVNSILENGQELTDSFTEIITSGPINSRNSIFQDFRSLDGPGASVDFIADFFDPEDVGLPYLYYLTNIPKRLWSVDRFTGAYTDTQNGQPVLLPVDGTLRDLRADNKLQAYLEKSLFGGTRTIDTNERIYGARSSNQLLDRTEVLCRKDFHVDVQQVTNTAASDQFDLGQLAGQGFGLGGDFLFDYTAEERGFVLINVSTIVPPSYVQAVDRNLMHTDYYDFLIPDFDSIGEQEVNPEELFFDKGVRVDNTMYNRRYYEYIDFLSRVAGDFKTTLRHWHDARFFKACPTLSPEFIRIDPENDDLERIFATYTHEQLLHFFHFSGVVVRPMSKFVQFGL